MTEPIAEPTAGDDAVAVKGNRWVRVHLSTAVGLILGGVCCVFVGRSIAHDWPQVRTGLDHAKPAWIALGFGFAALAMTAMANGWHGVIAMLGSRMDRGKVIAWYFVGELGKYLPGPVWPVLGRGELARRGGVPRARAYVSVALSLVMLYLGAMFVAAVVLPFSLAGGGGLGLNALFLLLLPLGLLALHPKVLDPMLKVAKRFTKQEVVDIPRWRTSVAVVLGYAPAWLFVALSTWAVSYAITPHPSFSRIAFAAVLSWIVGFLAIWVPGGVGVREAVFIAACGLPHGDAAAIAVIARILFVVVDTGGAGLSAPFLRHRGEVLRADEPGEGEVAAIGS